MKIISHRGCTVGADSFAENTPEQINKALKLGFDVEVDVWGEDGDLYLGHDSPKHATSLIYLTNPKLWCHAKNYNALVTLLPHAHVFWHQNDDVTLTSRGIPWCFPGVFVKGGITVEKGPPRDISNILGICTDSPMEWINKL